MVKTMLRRITFIVNVLLFGVLIGCDKMPLLAPSGSTLTLNAGSTVLPTGGSTTVTATVIESAGTPVHNGTTVRFTTSLGRVEPVEAQTNNGIATATFFAGDDSGIAEVRATSGGTGVSAPTTPTSPTSPTSPTTPTTPTTTSANSGVVQIAVGSGAVDTVTVRANPSTVSTTRGNTVNVIATVAGTGGRLLSSIPVSFSTNRGTLSATSAMTDNRGEASVTLTTNGDTDITVAAGSKTATAKVTGQAGPSVALSCGVGTATNCANVNQGQSVVFTAQRGATTSSIVSSTLDFGDGSNTVSLGALSSSVTVPHAYGQAGTYTATLTATDVSGETTSDTEIVQVLSPASASVSVTITTGRTVSANATTSVSATQYVWTFEGTTTQTTSTNTTTHTYTSAGIKTVSVTATLVDGRTVSASTQIDVP
jgi:PKD repeat protein